MVWHGSVDISSYSHDQPVSHTSCTSLVSVFLCCLLGDNGDTERVTSACDLDLPRIFLLSPHHDTRQLPGKLVFMILNVQNKSYCKISCAICVFFRCPYRVHYITSDSAPPTHLSHISQPSSDINSYFQNWNLGCLLRSSWEEIIVKVTLNFKCPPSPAVNTLKVLFSSFQLRVL